MQASRAVQSLHQLGSCGRSRAQALPGSLGHACPSLRLGPRRVQAGNGRSLSVTVSPAAPTNGASSLPATIPGPPAASSAEPECSPPPATFQKLVALGAAKAQLTWLQTFGYSVLGGAYISFGALFALSVGCACPGIAATDPGLQRLVLGVFGLPLGLILVMLTGAELFTGNTMLLTMASTQGRATPGEVLKSWVSSFAGNLVGSFGIVTLIGLTGLTIQTQAAASVAVTKTSLTFMEALTRGIIANWLVNLAIWLASSSSSLPGKILGAIVPVTAFTAMGMEHSVANMSLIPLGLALAGRTYQQFWINNLLPVVIGNIIGGAVFMGLALSWVHGKPKAAAT